MSKIREFSLVAAVILFSGSVLQAIYKTPYTVNIWDSPAQSRVLLQQAGFNRCRVFYRWSTGEPSNLPAGSDQYNYWYPDNALAIHQITGMKVCMSFLDPPQWAWNLGYAGMIQEAVNFTIDMLKYCDSKDPGCIDMIDVGNEMNCWNQDLVLREKEKEPSYYYADLLKAMYTAIKAYNPNIIVAPTAMFIRYGELEEEFLDGLYQLGCKGYFDRINFHAYYRDWSPDGHLYGESDPIESINDPSYTGFTRHYPTRIRYMIYVAEQNGDNASLVLNSEYGWKGMSHFENIKSQYYKYILDVSRQSGFCDSAFMYLGTWFGVVSATDTYDSDTSALIYTDAELGNANIVVPTTSYYMYKSYTANYPVWDPLQKQVLPVLPAASANASITNPGFESGTGGWSGATLDTSEKNTGANSGKCAIGGSITSPAFSVEPNRLYELVYWFKVTGTGALYFNGRSHYSTSKYTRGWRRFRQIVLTGASENSRSVYFGTGGGAGTFYVDDLSFNALNLATLPNMPANTAPNAPSGLACNGAVNPVSLKDFTPVLSWAFSDPDQGDVQSAYQLIVADSLNSINSNNGNIWDTGKVESIAMQQKYAGQAMQPGTYYWKARTWDFNDAQGAYPATAATFTINPMITLTSPNGGELWMAASQQTIKWTSQGVIPNVRIALSVDGGSTWSNLLASTANDGSEIISVPNLPGSNCRIKVDDASDGDPYDASDASFAISTGSANAALFIDASDDGISFGSNASLDVNNTNASGLTVEMYIKMDSSTGWKTIFMREQSSGGGNGGYSISLWDNNLRFKVITSAGEIMFEENTTKLKRGVWQHLACVSEGTTGKIFIDGSLISTKTDFGMPASVVNAAASVTPFGGTIEELRISNIARYSANFTKPDKPFVNDASAVGLWHFDEGAGITTKDEKSLSSAAFSGNPVWVMGYFNTTGGVSSGTITVLSPNGGESWVSNSQQTVTWSSIDGVGSLVDIDISYDGVNGPWTSVASGVSNSGSHSVIVPSQKGSTCRLRVKETQGAVSDVSDNNFTISGAGAPVIAVSSVTLSFGEIEINNSKSLTLEISNAGGGILTGTITPSQGWITATPGTFNIMSGKASISVSIDNFILGQKYGAASGEITIISNGNNGSQVTTVVAVEFNATCVLVKPNPVLLSSPLVGEGGVEGCITFFGDGIVPGQTTIKIYTLSGELIDVISRQSTVNGPRQAQKNYGLWTVDSGHPSITWQPSNLAPGIYVYTYDSPREKGVGKFTVIR